MLLARRLVEAGVRLVNVCWPREPGDNAVDNPLWDTHAQNFDRVEDVLVLFCRTGGELAADIVLGSSAREGCAFPLGERVCLFTDERAEGDKRRFGADLGGEGALEDSGAQGPVAGKGKRHGGKHRGKRRRRTMRGREEDT